MKIRKALFTALGCTVVLTSETATRAHLTAYYFHNRAHTNSAALLGTHDSTAPFVAFINGVLRSLPRLGSTANPSSFRPVLLASCLNTVLLPSNEGGEGGDREGGGREVVGGEGGGGEGDGGEGGGGEGVGGEGDVLPELDYDLKQALAATPTGQSGLEVLCAKRKANEAAKKHQATATTHPQTSPQPQT